MASTSSIRRRRLRTFASPDRNDGAAPPANKAGVGVPLTEQQTDNPALQKQLLDQQAKQFRRAVVVDGKDEEQELAIVLGFGSVSMMKNKLGDEYVEKSIRRLLERAEEMEREKNERNELFKNGKLYYERGACVDSIHPGTFSLPLSRSRAHRPHALVVLLVLCSPGMYRESTQALEQALVREGALSPLGGEIQMWLALGYNAVGNEAKCIEVYRFLEDNHPVPSIRKQAASLRYIMEAPKIALRPEEKVSIPVMEDVDRNLGRSGKDRPTRPRTQRQPRKKRELSLEEKFWDEYRPPNALQNKYVWAAAVAVALLGWWSLQHP